MTQNQESIFPPPAESKSTHSENHLAGFGHNCTHLRRIYPFKFRCELKESRFPNHLDEVIDVSVEEAAQWLEVSLNDVIRMAEHGGLFSVNPNVFKNPIKIYTKKSVSTNCTLENWAKQSNMSRDEVLQKISTGEYKVEITEKRTRILVFTRWQVTKCDFVKEGGHCGDFKQYSSETTTSVTVCECQ